MKINGNTIELSGDEVATAIDAYLVARWVSVVGPRTVRVAGISPTPGATVYVDPSGRVLDNGPTTVEIVPATEVAAKPTPAFGQVWRGMITSAFKVKFVLRQAATIARIESQPDDYDFVCMEPHQDGDFSYHCGSMHCRCES